jgi:hypothetical protein
MFITLKCHSTHQNVNQILRPPQKRIYLCPEELFPAPELYAAASSPWLRPTVGIVRTAVLVETQPQFVRFC